MDDAKLMGFGMNSSIGYGDKGYKMLGEGRGEMWVCLQNVIIKGIIEVNEMMRKGILLFGVKNSLIIKINIDYRIPLI